MHLFPFQVKDYGLSRISCFFDFILFGFYFRIFVNTLIIYLGHKLGHKLFVGHKLFSKYYSEFLIDTMRLEFGKDLWLNIKLDSNPGCRLLFNLKLMLKNFKHFIVK